MPRRGRTPQQKRDDFTTTLGLQDDVFKITYRGTVPYLQCTYCDRQLGTITLEVARDHVNCQRHQYIVNLRAQPREPPQEAFDATSPSENAFYKEFGDFLIAINVSFEKVDQPECKNFLEKYTGRKLPHSSTLRKRYLEITYNEKISKIRSEIGDGPIWISVDETTDHLKRNVAIAIVTPLCGDQPGTPRIIHSQVLRETNARTITEFFEESLSILWPEGIHHERVLIFISDAAPYMKAAGRQLGRHYPKMIHVTCINHALQRVIFEIKAEYGDVDNLIASVKAVFNKAPTRVDLFRELAPNIPLPPDVIVTRWGVWLQACGYYCDHFNAVARVINELDPTGVCSIEEAQRLIALPQIEEDLNHINNAFSHVCETITKLEKNGLSFRDARAIIDEARATIVNNVEVSQRIQEKLITVFDNNEGFRDLIAIHDLVLRGEFTMDDVIPGWTEEDARALTYAPTTSSEVERCFSIFKNIFVKNRSSLDFENLNQWLVVNCFMRKD